MDLRTYADVLRRRRRFVVLSLAGFLALAAVYSFSKTPVYTATSEVLVNPPSVSQVYRPDQLVSLDTEARLAASAPIAEIAEGTLRTGLSLPDLLEHVSVETTPETLVLDISFWSTDPNRAAAGADAFAQAYLQNRRQSAGDLVAEQRSVLQSLIDEAESERDRQNQILEDSVPGSAEFRNAEAERDTLNGQIAVLTSQLAQIPASVDPGQLILPASPPVDPSSPNHLINLALGIFVGGVVGVGGAFLRDRLDDRIRTEDQLEECMDAPVLASIPRISGWTRHGPSSLVTETQPESAGAEAFRTLRTSVAAIGRQRHVKVIAVVGATLGEGKTSTTANLASALAHTDSLVLAISADLRKPRLHEFFDVQNDVGLSDLLAGAAGLPDVVKRHDPKLFFISSGTPTPRPAELLESVAMENLLVSVREKFDYILIDTPPVLGLADALVVAPLADAVILVAHADTSRRSALLQAEQQLEQVGAMIHGCVLTNLVIGREAAYRYGYGYAYRDDRTKLGGPGRSSWIRRLWGMATPAARSAEPPRSPPGRAGADRGRAKARGEKASDPGSSGHGASVKTSPGGNPRAGARGSAPNRGRRARARSPAATDARTDATGQGPMGSPTATDGETEEPVNLPTQTDAQ